MITKETFIKILDLQKEQYLKERGLYKLGIELIDVNEKYERVITLLWQEVLTEEGGSWVSWFLYEKDYISGNLREDIKGWDGEVEIIRDVNELYDYLAENKYFKC